MVVKAPGEWNKMLIRCKGQVVSVWINDEKVNEADLSLYTSNKTNPDGTSVPPWLTVPKAEIKPIGFIGFQGKHGRANIYFREIKIRSLD